MLPLVLVTAFYRDRVTGQQKKLLDANRLLAEDFAPKWETWRRKAQARGWELLVDAPPAGSEYTRAMFRTPADQEALVADPLASAASVDRSTHQAGRGVDIDLDQMAATYPDFNYSDLVQMAAESGITNRVFQINGTEPWHFDDNPAVIYGSQFNAIQAIGNLKDQVMAALASGLDSPQMAAIKRAATGGALLLFVFAGGAFIWWMAHRDRGPKKIGVLKNYYAPKRLT